MSDDHRGGPQGGSDLGRRAFIQRMAVAGFAVPAIVTVVDVVNATPAAAQAITTTTTTVPTTTTTTTAPTTTTTSAPIFAFTGWQPPVDNPPTVNEVNGGQAIPMKFSLGGNQGLDVIASGYPTATQLNCSTGAPVNTGTLTDTAGGSGLQYDSGTGTYTYVWKTSKSWAGTCQQFDMRLVDGTDHTALFKFK